MNLGSIGNKKVYWISLFALTIRLYIAWRPLQYIDNLLIPDDTYLALKIAKNFAIGAGLTFDGIHLTNGFQPLYVFLVSPLYLLFRQDLITPVHICLSICAVFNVLTGLLIYRILSRLTDTRKGLIALILWSFSPRVIANGINGLESSLSLFFVALTVWFYIASVRSAGGATRRSPYLLGVFLGLSIFARIDAVFLLLAMSVDFILVSWKRSKSTNLVSLAINLGKMYLTAFLVLLPWWLFQSLYFKNLLPVSGEAVRYQALSYVNHSPSLGFFKDRLVLSLMQWLNSPFQFMSFSRLPALWEILSVVVVVAGVFVILVRKQKLAHSLSPLNFLWIMSLGLLFLYSFYVPAHWFFKRYYYPVIFILVMYWGVLFDMIFSIMSQKLKMPKIVSTALFVLFGGIMFYSGLQSFLFARPDSAVGCDSDGCSGYYQVALWIQDQVADGDIIGSYQSGALGYFLADNRVINLDGVVNGEALAALKNNSAFEYIRSEDINFVADWNINIKHLLVDHNTYELTDQEMTLVGTGPPQQTMEYYLFRVR